MSCHQKLGKTKAQRFPKLSVFTPRTQQNAFYESVLGRSTGRVKLNTTLS
ncbi:hypothetical protein [Leptospira noguchii]|nr:hypothetical protein [Leptospira noguchii]